MSGDATTASRAIAAQVVYSPDNLGAILAAIDPAEMAPPYSQVLMLARRLRENGTITDGGQFPQWEAFRMLSDVVPDLEHGFFADLAAECLPHLLDLQIDRMREVIANQRLDVAVSEAREEGGFFTRSQRLVDQIAWAREAARPRVLEGTDLGDLWSWEPPDDMVLIPELMHRQTRLVLTGFEGTGKSVVQRQFAIAAAAGLHPFKPHVKIEPVRTMLIDLENPERDSNTIINRMLCTLRDRRVLGGTRLDFESRCRVFHRNGMDVLGRASDRDWLRGQIEQHRPDLLVIGPAYRMAAAGGNLDETTAQRVLDYLNDLRDTYDLAIMTEAHSPKGATDEANANRNRGLTPSGSGVWMRFPEIGRGLRMQPEVSRAISRFTCSFERFRGDRIEVRFPSHIARATTGQVWWDDVSDQVSVLGMSE